MVWVRPITHPVGVGESIPLPDESVDMVYVSHVLHHATDVGRVLAEARRVLGEEGVPR